MNSLQRKIIIFSLLVFVPAACLFFPKGKAERQVLAFEDSKAWESCDKQNYWRRRLAAKLIDRLEPVLSWNKQDLVREALRSPKLRIKKNQDLWGYKEYSWPAFFARLQKFSEWGRRSYWVSTVFEFQETLKYDRRRLIDGNFGPWKEPRFLFVPAPEAVTRTGPKSLRLRLNSGDFKAYEAQLAAIIESAWSTSPYRLKVEWTEAADTFRFRFDPYAGLHHVDWKQKIIFLDEEISEGTLAHEIGHVLGFDDHYQYYWNVPSCAVLHTAYTRDIMGNSQHGKALAGHWRVLNRSYDRKAPDKFHYRNVDVLAD